MTTKILDNTTISVFLKDICKIDLLAKCLQRYTIATSIEVYKETKKGFPQSTLNQFYKNVTIHDLNDNRKFIELLTYLKNRYPSLHEGEISSFLISLLLYKEKGERYYYVTNDKEMRKTLHKMKNNKTFLQKIGWAFNTFNITGTIGLIIRLVKKDILTRDDIIDISYDLENSGFRITPALLEKLMGSKNAD